MTTVWLLGREKVNALNMFFHVILETKHLVVLFNLHNNFQVFQSFHSFSCGGSAITGGIEMKLRCTHHGVGVSGRLQVMAALSVSVGADAQTVGGVELLHEEGTAGLNHRRQLQQTRGWQKRLNGVLPQLETAWRTGRWHVEAGR